ncbi:hypothetical protein V6N12_002133 [Hibiscus sabdariffa]|uniref:Retrotransposon gag domain-containing protein n=1 Tax=Hibiscus sabdariffa TaxID=183260 RepID=A0ABR2AZA5_9ROSI
MYRANEPVGGEQNQNAAVDQGVAARPRAIRDHLAPMLDDLSPRIVASEIQAAHFELKPVMFNMLNSIGQFGGSPREDARQHIRAFLEVCDSFRQQGVHEDVLKLKLFPYSLRDRARDWLSGVPSGSMQSWADLCRSFLMRYNPPNMHTQLRNDIASFRQAIMNQSNGTLLDKSPEEAFDILDRIANNDYQFPTSRLGQGRRTPGKLDLDASDSVAAQLSAITNMLKNLHKPTEVQDARAVSCVHCDGNHNPNDCPAMHDQGGGNTSSANRQQNMNAPPGFQTNMPWQSEAKGNASTSHNSSLEATMQEFIASTKSLLHDHSTTIKNQGNLLQTQGALLQSHGSSLRALENQVGQIAQALQVQPQGGLPSDTEVTKRNGKEQCIVLTLRSGTTINKNVEFGGDENTEASPASTQKEYEVQDKAQEEEGREEVLITKPSGGQCADATAKAVPAQTAEDVRPPPPFPQRLKKHKEDT